ncbi:Protein CBG17138 [Caenorhabditis briggsae]|uniref:Protein CBG17138 n=1 Tax=Caenorhabditis briggsae TaxID=6238 RepID=A8XQP5_CAEBR|nr:Protein CBG17138 [Caenorhabditis briggsae]CAP34970.1 Protein CBG17138 [Caenorhabditis briggsae]
MSNRCLQVCQRCRPKSCQNSNCLKTSESSRSLRIDVAPALLWTSFLLELQTAQTMEYPEEFDENDRILRDTILQPLLSCQEQEKFSSRERFCFTWSNWTED